MAFAQKTITGIVKDQQGTPISGVVIHQKKDIKIQTQTTGEGKYTISAQEGDVLVFSFLGKKTIERSVGQSATIDVVLENEGASPQGTPTDPPAGVARTNVRGPSSIYGASKPLWVVDGVILDNDIELSPDALSSSDAKLLIASALGGLSSDDIASFRVLKDASATSIYGPRAVAGVVEVTTRRGTQGTSSITYTNESTFRFIPTYNNFNIMNSQEQMDFDMEMLRRGNYSYHTLTVRRNKGEIARMYELLNTAGADGRFGLDNTDAAKTAYLQAAERRNTDWFAKLFQASVIQNHSVSITTGTDKASYYASVSFLTDPGWMKFSNNDRYSANLNANYKLSKKVTFNVIVNGAYREARTPGSVDPITGKVSSSFDLNPYSYALNAARTLDPSQYYNYRYAPMNIFEELQNNYTNTNVGDIKVQGRLSWKITPKIEASALAAIKYQSISQELNQTEYSNLARAYRATDNLNMINRNEYLYEDPYDAYDVRHTVLPEGGIREKTQSILNGKDFRATIDYKDSFLKGIHKIQLFGGMETNDTYRNKDWNKNFGLLYGLGEISFFSYEALKQIQESRTPNYYTVTNTTTRNVAFFSNATYGYKDRYIFNGTLRTDASNKFASSRYIRWMPTWNIALTWNVSKESFFPKLKPISNLSFKASFGVTPESPSVSNSLAKIVGDVPWRSSNTNRETALRISEAANYELTYEKKQELNIGTQVGFFHNRINLALDWYTRNNYDLIGRVPTQGLNGSILRYGNVASMRAYGVDLSLETQNIKLKDFSWTTTFIYAKNENEITELYVDASISDMVSGNGFSKQGYPVGSIFSIPFRGLNQDGLPTFSDANGNTTIDGLRFDQRNNLDFLQYSGTTKPTDVGSLGNLFKYKGLSLNILFTYSFGNVLRLPTAFSASYNNDALARPKEFANRWMQPGDEHRTNVPVIASFYQQNEMPNLQYAYTAYNYSDVRIAKGDFIRLKEISLGYDFDRETLRAMKIKRLGVKLQASNLFLLYADKKLNGADPEYAGLSSFVPNPKQITFSLRVGL
ncbi:MAG: SusC/RagA family TonB-linked outer membrane protein [Capnocytophaga sp.]|nr:SusC/RagA family TonB-linked outer membrane protein [Capnocytophaga sp.]